MTTYSIGEIEQISGVKAHILRYWEEVIPSIAPNLTVGGHREYSRHDLQIILRLKYLIYEKKFTIEGARNQILEEGAMIGSDENTLKLYEQIVDLKSDLLGLLRIVRSMKKGKNEDEKRN